MTVLFFLPSLLFFTQKKSHTESVFINQNIMLYNLTDAFALEEPFCTRTTPSLPPKKKKTPNKPPHTSWANCLSLVFQVEHKYQNQKVRFPVKCQSDAPCVTWRAARTKDDTQFQTAKINASHNCQLEPLIQIIQVTVQHNQITLQHVESHYERATNANTPKGSQIWRLLPM